MFAPAALKHARINITHRHTHAHAHTHTHTHTLLCIPMLTNMHTLMVF